MTGNTGWTQEGAVDVPGARLHWRRRGRGPTVVLAHGATFSGRAWDRLAVDLETDFDVVAYDARNHGLSSAPDELEPIPGADLIALVGALSLRRPAALGHSMGAASVAFAAAARPDLFRAIVLEDPPWQDGPGGGPAVASEHQRGLMDGLLRLSRSPLEEVRAVGRDLNPDLDDDELRLWAEGITQFRPSEGWGTNILADDWRDVAIKLLCPTLLVCGEPGVAIVGPAVAEEAARLAADLRSVTLPGAGHNIRQEAYPGYVAAVQAFLLQTAA